MAETVLSFVLDQLSTFLREEGRLLGGLRQEVQFIRDELEQMRAFLREADAKEEDAQPRLQEWIKQVRDAAYDTEDILDEFVARFARHRATGFYGSVRRIFSSIKNLRARHRVATEIQSIKSRIKSISEGHQRYQSEYGISAQASGSLSAVNNTTWRYSRDDALLVEEAKLVGIDQPKKHLISQLLRGDDYQLKVVSVVGMGGLGKTTLVKRVHEDPEVRRHFPVRAWVTVSQTCDFQYLLKDLIRQLHKKGNKPVPQSIESLNITELKEFVKDFLQQAGRYEVLSTKIEIRLAKAEAVNWASLEYSRDNVALQRINVSSGSQRPTYPSSRATKDWDKLEAQMKKEEKDEKLDGDAALNKFFRDIYKDADEDTRRAMMKSFVESNGTVLSTNWKEVGAKKVEGSPPDGMEMKKWEY